jgi:hypothetical protein
MTIIVECLALIPWFLSKVDIGCKTNISVLMHTMEVPHRLKSEYSLSGEKENKCNIGMTFKAPVIRETKQSIIKDLSK